MYAQLLLKPSKSCATLQDTVKLFSHRYIHPFPSPLGINNEHSLNNVNWQVIDFVVRVRIYILRSSDVGENVISVDMVELVLMVLRLRFRLAGFRRNDRLKYCIWLDES